MSTTFTQRDEFNRKVVAENLIKLFTDTKISPVVIDGPWGSGKSEFCNKFVNLCEEKKVTFKCIYIDAFKYDHSDDPLVMMISAIASLITDETKKKELVKAAIPVAKVLGKTAGKAAISWVLRTNADQLGDELSEAITSGGEEAVDGGIKKLFENFEKAEESLKIFKDSLKKITENEKIVLVIDELDRCRPSFALTVLEKMKHVFDVDGVSFLISTNLKQMEAIVKKQYGLEIDAETYLSKFFAFNVHLPQDHKFGNDYSQNASRLFFNLVNANASLKKHYSHDSTITDLFNDLFELHGRSLRDAEKFYRNIEVYNQLSGESAITENTMWIYQAFYMFGIYIYTFNPKLSARILRGQFTSKEISEFLGYPLENLEKVDRQDFRARLLAIFYLEDKDTPPRTPTGEEYRKDWNVEISQSFSAGRDPGRGNRVWIIQKVIRKLQLV